MSEPLVLRVKRLISGSVNEVVDALENANPELVMREAIREIERAIADLREELGSVMALRQQTARLIEKSKTKLAELGERARLAVEQGRDDLAEAAVSRQLDIERDIPFHEARASELAAKQSELDGYRAGLEARKAQMEADIASFARDREASALAAGADGGAGGGPKAERRADRAQSAFDRAMSGSVGAVSTRPDRLASAKLEELERLSRSTEVGERLQRLKAQVKAS